LLLGGNVYFRRLKTTIAGRNAARKLRRLVLLPNVEARATRDQQQQDR
jgi:hypothetical protein